MIPHLITATAAIVSPSPIFDGVMVTLELDGRLQRVQAGVVVPHLRALNERLAVANEQRRAVRIELGRLLVELKRQVPHGMWLQALRNHAGIHPKTAQRCMAEAEKAAGVRPVAPNVVKNDKVSFCTQSGDVQAWQERKAEFNSRWRGEHEGRAIDPTSTTQTSFLLPSPQPATLPGPPAAAMPPALRQERVVGGAAVRAVQQMGGKQMELASEYQAAAVRRAREVGMRIETAAGGRLDRGLAKAIGELTDRWAAEVDRLLTAARPGVV